MKRITPLAVLFVVMALAAACGDDGDDGASSDRTVEVDMVDIDFEPSTLAFEPGETVRFVFQNRGEVAHDAFIGNREAQDDHERDMREAEEGGEGAHHGDGGDDGTAITVEPGESGELTHTFDEEGTLEIGCHQPGHYDDGMKITVTVG